jgi:transcriptional regulator with XRE-family HTH domain
MLAITIGQNIKKQLEQLAIKPADLCRQAKLDPSQVSRMLRGKCYPSIESLARVAKVLGVSPGSLLDGSDDQKRQHSQDSPSLRLAMRTMRQLDETDLQKVLAIVGQIVDIIDHSAKPTPPDSPPAEVTS